jgi:oligopeptide/dipeptide ABC transporter ATP-binding protein
VAASERTGFGPAGEAAMRPPGAAAGQDEMPPQGRGEAEGLAAALLDVHDLRTEYFVRGQTLRAVDGVSFAVRPGEAVGLVGESGCGKSATTLSLLRLIPPAVGRVAGGRALFEGIDLVRCSDRELRRIRGNRIGMIFQDPATSLNPMLTIGQQIGETLRAHMKLSGRETAERSVELLRRVRIPDPSRRLSSYPHELSGGMRQRVMIAIAVSCEPSLVLADEPTTALDVTIQAQILELLAEMADSLGSALVLITHNLGVVSSYTDRTLVMYAGRIVEEASTRDLFRSPRHPYTMGLLESVPRLRGDRGALLRAIEGAPPNPLELRRGCAFAPRCRFADERSWAEEPALEEVATGHRVACWVKPEV